MMSLVLSNLINRDDSRVVEVGRGFRLCLKPLNLFNGCKCPCKNHFECDNSIELFLSRFVDNAHAPSCNFL